VIPISTSVVLQLCSRSADETKKIAARLARLLSSGDVICLEGELGTGKTCFAQGLGLGLGVRVPMISPTFTLVREYPAIWPPVQLYHIDLYRIQSLEEALALGIEEYLYGDGICVIEWAERIREIIPTERLWITLSYLGETERGLHLEATGAHYEEVLRELTQQLESPASSCAEP